MESYDIKCPNCHSTIHIPFMRELEAKAIAEADLAELTAREELSLMKSRLRNISLMGLLKFWLRRQKME